MKLINLKNIKDKNKFIFAIIFLLISIFFIFKGQILGFCIEKINYYGGYKCSVLITGDLKKNFMYGNNRDIGGLEYGNYDLRANSSGIIYTVDIEDLGCDLSATDKDVLVGYGESKIPIGHLK